MLLMLISQSFFIEFHETLNTVLNYLPEDFCTRTGNIAMLI